MLASTASESQRQTLRLYGELMAQQESWAGKFLFTCGEGMTATGLATAMSIAGGTTLVLDPDAATVKGVFRQGGVDFVVNTLDEALRALKNEIRKKRPLSVALLVDMQPVIAEMTERGVLPDLLVEWAEGAEPLAIAAGRRMLLGPEPSDELKGWLASRGWSDAVLRAKSTAELREMDARVLAVLPADDAVRRAWVQRIGHYHLATAGSERVVWLTSDERVRVGPPRD